MSEIGPVRDSEWTEEMLMAFVDGELDGVTAERLAAAVSADPALARRADAFRSSSQAARAVFGNVLSEPVPHRLVSAILAAQAPPARNRILNKRRPLSRNLLRLAASALLAAGFGGSFWLGGYLGDTGALQSDRIAALLASQPSGPLANIRIDGRDAGFTVLGSYDVADGICRIFRLDNPGDAIRGIGCDRGSGFHVEMTVADAPATGFSPASQRATELIDAYLDSAEAGVPMNAEEEARRLGIGTGR